MGLYLKLSYEVLVVPEQWSSIDPWSHPVSYDFFFVAGTTTVSVPHHHIVTLDATSTATYSPALVQ